MGTFHNLDNEEVIFIYLSNQKFLEKYNEVFEIGGIESYTDLSESTVISTFKQLTEEDIMELLEDPHYKYCLSVEKKLKPIVDIIQDAFPDLYDKVVECFTKPPLE